MVNIQLCRRIRKDVRFICHERGIKIKSESTDEDSNPVSSDHRSDALPTELNITGKSLASLALY